MRVRRLPGPPSPRQDHEPLAACPTTVFRGPRAVPFASGAAEVERATPYLVLDNLRAGAALFSGDARFKASGGSLVVGVEGALPAMLHPGSLLRELRLRLGTGRSEAPVSTRDYRGDLQGLRGVAVLLVALNHAGIGYFKGGYVGVDVFFVLSGFLITGLLLDGAARTGHVSFGNFYVRRVRRILPAAALTLATTTIVANVLLNYVREKQIAWDSFWATLFAANIRFAHEGTNYFAQGQPPSPIQHYWSLAVEEQFYLAWPALLAIALLGVFLPGGRGEAALDLCHDENWGTGGDLREEGGFP
jgi:Acyltransferase family